LNVVVGLPFRAHRFKRFEHADGDHANEQAHHYPSRHEDEKCEEYASGERVLYNHGLVALIALEVAHRSHRTGPARELVG
jgi:hypothetical protein